MTTTAEQAPSSQIAGVILAGGPGSRIGGNKPWRHLGSHRLIDLAIDTISQVCQEVVVSTADVAAMADLPLRIIADRWPGQGPLAAMATVFMDTDYPAIIIMAVDLPLVRPGLLRLLATAHGRHRAAAPMGPKWPEPLLCYYHRDCLPTILRMLERGERRPRMLLEAVGGHIFSQEEVRKVDPEMVSFLNVNFPEDLERAASIARESGLFDTK